MKQDREKERTKQKVKNKVWMEEGIKGVPNTNGQKEEK